jgi:MerR HTH family regulatory protein
LISIWFMAHLPSQSSATDASQLGRACSLPSKLRSLGRSISILQPWKPILPLVFPQRCARRKGPRAWRGPQIASSALRFYEERGLISSERAGSGHRRYSRSVLRRIAVIVFAQRIGLTLDEIGAELGKLPADRIPTRGDWARLSGG